MSIQRIVPGDPEAIRKDRDDIEVKLLSETDRYEIEDLEYRLRALLPVAAGKVIKLFTRRRTLRAWLSTPSESLPSESPPKSVTITIRIAVE
jgi:hypothetical protein